MPATRTHRQQTDEERAEDDLNTESHEGGAKSGGVLVAELTESPVSPSCEDGEQDRRTCGEQSEAEYEPMLEVNFRAELLEDSVMFPEMCERID